jgi:adenylate cyclase
MSCFRALQDAGEILSELDISVGIATGVAVFGNVGSEGRTDYTVIGNPVSTAKRLQESAGYGEILICEATHETLSGEVSVGGPSTLSLKGRSVGVQVWPVLCTASE